MTTTFTTLPSTLVSAATLIVASLGLAACGGGDTSGHSANAPKPDGAALFKTNCATCHGDTGRGDGFAATSLRVRPRDLTAEPYRYLDIAGAGSELEALVSYITIGKDENGMPPFGHLAKGNIRAMAEFVASIRPEPDFIDGQPPEEATEPPANEAGEG